MIYELLKFIHHYSEGNKEIRRKIYEKSLKLRRYGLGFFFLLSYTLITENLDMPKNTTSTLSLIAQE